MGNVGSYDSDTATTVMTVGWSVGRSVPLMPTYKTNTIPKHLPRQVLFASGGISVIFCALRAICMVGQTACCLCEV